MTLSEVQFKIEALAKLINVPKHLLPTYGHSTQDSLPHIEVDGNFVHYVISERGVEFSRSTHFLIDEILYLVFSGVTFSMAARYEAENRNVRQDFRRILFQKQLELLGMLNPEWQKRQAAEQQRILVHHPFNDG